MIFQVTRSFKPVTNVFCSQRSGRGNIFLESAVPLAKSLHKEIVLLGRRIEAVAVAEETLTANHTQPNSSPVHPGDLADIITSIEALLARIDREIPLLQLAISASGENLSTSVPTGISPSRLLQASTFLTIGDTQFAQNPNRPVQIGPAFTLSLYMLFLGHANTLTPPQTPDLSIVGDATDLHGSQANKTNPTAYGLDEGARKPLWQEVLHKARVRICRTRRDYVFDSARGFQPGNDAYQNLPGSPSSHSPIEGGHEYIYHLEIVEDLDDGRVHDGDEGRPYDNISTAGIRESIPIHQVSKLFYTDTGRILNIGNAADGEQNPVLLLKRDVQAVPSWLKTNEFADYVDAESEDGSSTTEASDQDSDQAFIDQQLFGESVVDEPIPGEVPTQARLPEYRFPAHLDSEWLALEVYEEDEFESLGDEDESIDLETASELGDIKPKQSPKPVRSSLDSKVVDQIKRLSLPPSTDQSPEREELSLSQAALETRKFVARSPFGAITTSLSLMEMLVRLTSLQEFQQASHLSIPDHILSFFLEETSTTGLVGETHWRVRSDAKRRVGFDPYTDVPSK